MAASNNEPWYSIRDELKHFLNNNPPSSITHGQSGLVDQPKPEPTEETYPNQWYASESIPRRNLYGTHSHYVELPIVYKRNPNDLKMIRSLDQTYNVLNKISEGLAKFDVKYDEGFLENGTGRSNNFVDFGGLAEIHELFDQLPGSRSESVEKKKPVFVKTASSIRQLHKIHKCIQKNYQAKAEIDDGGSKRGFKKFEEIKESEC